MSPSIRLERTRYLLEREDRERWRRTERRLQEMLGVQQVEEQLLRNEMRLRRQGETSLRAANARLRELALELQEANRSLQQTNQDLEQFAYLASHDLQEPLRMVAQHSERLRELLWGRLTESEQQSLNYLNAGAERMTLLVRDLLEYARVDDSALDEDVNCSAVVKYALENLQHAIEEADAQIDVGPLPGVTGSSRLLQQLFQNLLSNAIKFRRDCPLQITVTSQTIPGGFEIAVADNGLGISTAHQERIFHVFHRLHSAEQYSGTGIGLALVRRIANRHGGNVTLESELGVGSTFTVLLPHAR